MQEAEKYHVLPLDDRVIERTNATIAGRTSWAPHLAHPLRGDAGHAGKHLHEREELVEQDHRGTRHPGRRRQRRDPVAGRALRRLVALHEGRASRHTYNFLGLERYTVAAPDALATGPATVTVDFAYDGGGNGKGGKATSS